MSDFESLARENSEHRGRRRRRRRKRSSQASFQQKSKSKGSFFGKKKRGKHKKMIARLDIEGVGGTYTLSSYANKVALVLFLIVFVILFYEVYWIIRDDMESESTAVSQTKGSAPVLPALQGENEEGGDINNTGSEDQAIFPEMNNKDQGQDPSILAELKVKATDVSFFDPLSNQAARSKMTIAVESSSVGLYREAFKLVEEAKALDPEAVGIPFLKSTIYRDQEDWEKMEKALQESIRKKEFIFLSYYELANIARRREDLKRESLYLSEARKRIPQHPETLLRLSAVLKKLGEKEKSWRYLKQYLHLIPDDEWAVFKLRLLEIDMDRWQGSKGLTKNLTSSNPSPYWLATAGAYYLKQGNGEKSKEYLQRLKEEVSDEQYQKIVEDPIFEASRSEPSE